MAFSVKLTQKTQAGGVNPVVATRTLLDDISSTASTVAFEKEVSMTGNVTIGDASSDSLLLLGGRIQSLSALQWTCKNNESRSLQIGSSDVPNLININTTANKVTIESLEVMENLTKIDTVNLTIKDPLIKLGNGNNSDNIDLGFYAQYNNGTTKYAGLFRDADDDGKFKLFKDLTSEPYVIGEDSNINIDTTNYTNADLVVGSLEVATTPIGVSSGGTGQTTYTDGDILYASNSTTLSKLNKGGDSTVLQVNASGTLTYGTVTNAMLAGSIANNKLSYSTISGISLGNNLNNLTVDDSSLKLDDGTITTYNGSAGRTISIKDSGVTTAKIADSNVTTAKINNSAVTTAKIANSAITTAKIADSNVTTAKINNSAVTTAKIANSAITTI